MNAEEIAQICHEANRRLQLIQNEAYISPDWNELDDETRESAVDGVKNAMRGATPRESHANWVAFKLKHGWQHGETRDDEHKLHPCIVPYDRLPESQKRKDALFTAIVRALHE